MPWVISLLLALQWGGSKYAWGSWRIILLLTLFGVLLVLWVVVQVREGDKATVPVKIISQRSMASGVWYMFCTFSNFFIIVYYIPIWFQTVRNYSAYQSGINFLTTSAAMSLTVICAGIMVFMTPGFLRLLIADCLTDWSYWILCSSNDCVDHHLLNCIRSNLHIRHQHEQRSLVRILPLSSTIPFISHNLTGSECSS